MTEFENKLLQQLEGIRIALEHIANKSNFRATDFSNLKLSNQQEVVNDVVVNNIDFEHKNSQLLMSQNDPSINRLFFGTPDGSGFDECNVINDPDSPKVLYVVETIDGINGKFYPLSKGYSRLKSNAKSFLLPLCELRSNLDSIENFNILPNDYGEIKLEDGYWNVKKKCIIKC
ncbi:MAG: hypothetical protein HDR88_17845 [Bacteroides sp.]|nr:hypothetical protein [Bacteroides sp.]